MVLLRVAPILARVSWLGDGRGRGDRKHHGGGAEGPRAGGKPPRGGQHAKDQKRSQETVRNASKPVDPDSPFAKLLALKAQLEKRDG